MLAVGNKVTSCAKGEAKISESHVMWHRQLGWMDQTNNRGAGRIGGDVGEFQIDAVDGLAPW